MAETCVKEDVMELGRIVFYGRTLHEYQSIFGFDHDDYAGLKILDCPGGASSFTAEACRLGVDVVAVDPMFGKPAIDLLRAGGEDISHTLDSVAKSSGLFNWSFYPTPEVLRSYRMTALRRFSHDYATPGSAERYVNACLPNLPFDDGSFDVALSGHFLFTYSDMLDCDFHLKALLELVRVSRKEVKIYPVVGRNGKKPAFFNDLLAGLGEVGVKCELIPSKFEFMKGAREILRLTRQP
jgi:hypothetical protein